jgi:hypothetical protein
MKEIIIIVLWISGAGYRLGEAESWKDCEDAMIALEKLNVETSCHLHEVSIRPKKRPW